MIDQPIDAIGSVANYFIENGWRPGEPVTSEAHSEVSDSIAELANRKRKTRFTAEHLRNKGAPLSEKIDPDKKLNVLMLDASEVVSESNAANVYIVRGGDTACQIAERLKVSCKSLFKLNKLNSNGDIYRGQRLKLPLNAKNQDAHNSGSIQQRFFFTHRNFYAITEYNHSVLYAMAVHDLSKAIDAAKSKHGEAVSLGSEG